MKIRYYILLALPLVVLIPVVTLAVVLTTYTRDFLESSGLTINEVRYKLTAAYEMRDLFAEKRVNFLIVGLDKRDDQLEQTLLTDTIVFASLDTRKASLVFIPLPRDLWIEPLKTKVNALYFYGQLKEETTGVEFLREQASLVIDQPIEFSLILDYKNLPELIDLIGGVRINVKQSFQDDFYPNPSYLEASQEGEPKYISVKFEKGERYFNGEEALQFIRSRLSEDLKQGSDLARSARQMQLINGLINKLKSPQLMKDAKLMGRLYKFWQEKMETNLEDEEVLSMLMATPWRNLQMSSLSIPSSYDKNDQEAILVYPGYLVDGLWVWQPKSGDWNELREFIRNNL